MINSGKEPVYGTNGLPEKQLLAVQIVAVLTLAFTCVVVILHLINASDALWKNIFYGCWLWWVFAPPVWFSYEYFKLYKRYGQDGTFEAFKYGQELAYRSWIGIAAILSVIASKSG